MNMDERIKRINELAHKQKSEGLTEEAAAEIRKTLRDLRFNEAVCLEYEKDYAGALAAMEEIAAEYGEDEALTHEILFLKSRT